MDADRLGEWLAPIDGMPLECDGLTRVASTLLRREAVAHQVFAGELIVEGVGVVRPHYWIRLADGRVIDYRARMWLSPSPAVPHGVFRPPPEVRYQGEDVGPADLPAAIFEILSRRSLESFPAMGNDH